MTRTSSDAIGRWLERFGASDVCAAHELCDRHVPYATAFTVVSATEDGRVKGSEAVTYGQLSEASRRLATALADRGIGRGDTVAVLMGKSRDLAMTLLAIWRLGAVHVPLFTAFATPAIELRVRESGATMIITDPGQRHKVDDLTGLQLIVSGPELAALIAGHEPLSQSVAVGGDGTLIQLFTSGTTGSPKAVPVPVRALAAFAAYMHYGLDVSADDVYWNAADPGWAYGLYYGILGPLAIGRPNLLLQAGFSPGLTNQVLTEFQVTNFAAAPTAYRSLSKAPTMSEVVLRRASSAGEPLTPDVLEWSRTTLGIEVRDHYGQTELGMVIGNAWADEALAPVKPGSMGRQLPGFTANVVDGKIAIDTASSPLMWFTGYVDAPDKTAERFTSDGRWYFTGDTGRVDDDGYFFFAARDDDVVIMAGYRIGPFDVESVLIRHPAVVDVAVFGVPDELRGEILEACVVVKAGTTADDALVAELQQLVKREYAAHAYPRRIHLVDELPKTPSGKIQRFKLRATYGPPVGVAE